MNPGLRLSTEIPAALLLAIATISLGCAASPRQRPVEMGPVATGPGTLMSARKFLEGRWALESFAVHPPGQAPMALKGSGMLVYGQGESQDGDPR